MQFASVPRYDASGTSTAELLNTGMTVVTSVEIENPNGAPVYLQLFDAAAIADVTVGTTTPDYTRMVPLGSAAAPTSRIIEVPIRFAKGCVYAVTTTRSGNGNPGTACPLNFTFQ